jgi:hypothetical protein
MDADRLPVRHDALPAIALVLVVIAGKKRSN